MTKTLLPDVNVWLALVFDSHLHHSAALQWMNGVSLELCCFCRSTQQGFLRLANNPKVFPVDAVSVDEAWRLYDTVQSDPRVSFAEEPVGIETGWRDAMRGRRFSPKVWNDAYLVAFAQVGGFEIVTFDGGFLQYSDVSIFLLK